MIRKRRCLISASTPPSIELGNIMAEGRPVAVEFTSKLAFPRLFFRV
jgi:hypothetical protein